MEVIVKMPNEFKVIFEEEEFEGLSESERGLLIKRALSEVVMEQVSWFSVPKDN